MSYLNAFSYVMLLQSLLMEINQLNSMLLGVAMYVNMNSLVFSPHFSMKMFKLLEQNAHRNSFIIDISSRVDANYIKMGVSYGSNSLPGVPVSFSESQITTSTEEGVYDICIDIDQTGLSYDRAVTYNLVILSDGQTATVSGRWHTFRGGGDDNEGGEWGH